MKKSTFINTILATLLFSASHSALANGANFKVAVVKGAIGSADITQGELASGIKKLTASEKSKNSYASKMNLCVAYLQANYQEKSESACTAAIESLESMPNVNRKVKYLTALNYSNRGVARYRKNQLLAALADFKVAVAIDKNSITNSNLENIRQLLPVTKVDTNLELSD